MNKKISAALISVFYKDGLEPVVRQLQQQGTTIYSTGGTQKFIEDLGIPVVPVEQLTSYPSILGGRVKTLHPLIFGGILGRRNNETDVQEMKQYGIPELDLVIVDLYPFQETVANTTDEKLIIEKVDIGGPSMIRGAAKNFSDVTVLASKDDYANLVEILELQNGETTLEQRRKFAAKAFQIVADYDIAITNYFSADTPLTVFGQEQRTPLRYGENPHQQAAFFGNLSENFNQLHGKEISYNNLVDIDAAIELIQEFEGETTQATFAIIKHTNVCGISSRPSVEGAWKDALAGDAESAFGGVLVCNGAIDIATANAINEIFFEVLIAPAFDADALTILQSKKNRILLQLNKPVAATKQYKNVLNGTLVQDKDKGNYEKWEDVGGRPATASEREDLLFANIVCKHLKSNAIALVKNKQLVGKGCGQTSRIDALRHAVEKAKQFSFDLKGAVMASDAFFPFNDCVKLGDEAGITAFVQPGGSIRDKDSIEYCKERNLAMVMTGMRHFRH
ncbi:bifunctional phosphoribosylaminoimidazolecarboxamide formyltransferase/IMP cyclohydrolase [Flavisolibacter tropicus]|uniref:Bifunctional purine biosynthesis protein PurH n=1 Tax=Flavisolibacter tropicus TaxID=1492898 RepID=A0A172TY79_9BACT|nr:bifunctional phosphoribosylaminoimidazolecarboxamide formyltransferase/IMP cyclohydrolase [Flavisolibacter tropicus]ANE52049.1 phosphoribosylaminoimidazolecarboxamide formyltransferase [Flavisolibacter tropicus]